MNYKNLYIGPFLKHASPSYFDCLTLKEYLWYTTSKESYIQRNASLDNTPFDYDGPCYSSLIDNFVLIFLFYALNLDAFFYYPISTSMSLVDTDVDSLTVSDLSKNLLFLHSGNKSSIFSFFDKMRNSLAHGTFNFTTDQRLIMIGQAKAKPTSMYNFFLQEKIGAEWKKDFFRTLNLNFSDDKILITKTLSMIPEMRIDNARFYYRGYEIIIDKDFKFEKAVQNPQEMQLIAKFNNERFQRKIIIISESSNLTLEKLNFQDNKVQIIPCNKMIEFFGIKILKRK